MSYDLIDSSITVNSLINEKSPCKAMYEYIFGGGGRPRTDLTLKMPNWK